MRGWREQVLELARRYDHPSWGEAHCRRVYDMATRLASSVGGADDDVLFAASYLHDLGALVPWRKPALDHAERSMEVVPGILGPTDFPSDKLSAVLRAIGTHMFSSRTDGSVESAAIRDADTLDFLGAIGTARLISAVGISDWTPDLPTALELIKQFTEELPGLVAMDAAKPLAAARAAEAMVFVKYLANATDGLRIL